MTLIYSFAADAEDEIDDTDDRRPKSKSKGSSHSSPHKKSSSSSHHNNHNGKSNDRKRHHSGGGDDRHSKKRKWRQKDSYSFVTGVAFDRIIPLMIGIILLLWSGLFCLTVVSLGIMSVNKALEALSVLLKSVGCKLTAVARFSSGYFSCLKWCIANRDCISNECYTKMHG